MKKLLLSALSALTVLSVSASIEGTYTVKTYVDNTVGDSYTFASGDVTSNESEDAEFWEVVITATEDGYTIENLLNWEETLEAEYNAETGELVIAGGTEVAEGYNICGGIGKNYNTAKLIMDLCDQYNSYVPDWGLNPVTLVLEDGLLVCKTPVLVYVKGSYNGYCGYAYDIYYDMTFEKFGEEQGEDPSKISSINVDENAPVEYYNLQGVRIANPANGQIVIKRQGSHVSKLIVR